MRKKLLLLLACVALGGCSAGDVPGEGPRLLSHDDYADMLVDSGLDSSKLGRSWLNAAARYQLRAPGVDLPFQESGVFFAHETRAAAYAFDGVRGQQLGLSLIRHDETGDQVFVDVFYIDESGADIEYRHIASLGDANALAVSLEHEGRYVVRLQPELLASVNYDLRIELAAALTFPVSELGPGDVGSFYGAPRDGGRRRHEGIDIFAPRLTPVIAVASGTAVTRQSTLGGNTVWLRSAKQSYYYAHLENAAFDGRRNVVAGDILGYVGNSGNAITTTPHLHFGIYRRSQGAIDPMPYVISRLHIDEPDVALFSPGYATTTAPALNLRTSPKVLSDNIVETLAAGTAVDIVAASGDWVRVRTPGGGEGWIHRDFQREPVAQSEFLVSAGAPFVYPDSVAPKPALQRLAPGTRVNVFAEESGALLVGVEGGNPIGWLR